MCVCVVIQVKVAQEEAQVHARKNLEAEEEVRRARENAVRSEEERMAMERKVQQVESAMHAQLRYMNNTHSSLETINTMMCCIMCLQ